MAKERGVKRAKQAVVEQSYPALEPPAGGPVTPTPRPEVVLDEATGDLAHASTGRQPAGEGVTVQTSGPVGFGSPRVVRAPGAEAFASITELTVGQNVLLEGRIPAVVLGFNDLAQMVVIRTGNLPAGCTHVSVKPGRLYRLVEPTP